ncbi:acyl-CoA thioesterase [Aeromicrobium sp. UC242_57]|uniref:acyl-CoA thioesterase n=1 Tax=Aeromicrobium sp. UC242_57 TaxID=3374624 RepID=UPI003798B411
MSTSVGFPPWGWSPRPAARSVRQLNFPGDVQAGLAITKLGTSSIVYRIGLFQGDTDEPAAIGKFVHVYVDSTTRKPTPIPDEIRAALEPLASLPKR